MDANGVDKLFRRRPDNEGWETARHFRGENIAGHDESLDQHRILRTSKLKVVLCQDEINVTVATSSP